MKLSRPYLFHHQFMLGRYGSGMVAELIRFEKILRAVDYPIAQEDLVNFAIENGADDEIIQALQSLPNHTFATPNDVFEALSSTPREQPMPELIPQS